MTTTKMRNVEVPPRNSNDRASKNFLELSRVACAKAFDVMERCPRFGETELTDARQESIADAQKWLKRRVVLVADLSEEWRQKAGSVQKSSTAVEHRVFS